MMDLLRRFRKKTADATQEPPRGGPLDVLYNAADVMASPFVVAVTSCIDALGFSFSGDGLPDGCSVHPYTRTILEYSRGRVDRYAVSSLREYYRQFQPATMADLFPEAASTPAATLPSNTHFTPWFTGTPDDRAERTRRALQREFPGLPEPGNPLFGPIDDRQGEMEFVRLVEVYRSLRDKGYVLPRNRRNHIQGLVLRREGDFRFLVTAGKHRVAALSVLGVADIPVVFRSPVIIEVRDVGAWPFVNSHGWSETAAISYFDRLFRGVSARALSSNCSGGDD